MKALSPVLALLIGTAILLTGGGLQGLLLPVRAGLENFSALEIALTGSCFFVGYAAGCMLGPRLVRNVGHIRAFAAMTAMAAALALSHGLLVVAPCWWVLRAGSGFCFAVLAMVIESWLNERSTREDRGAVLSAYMIINLTVVTVGQMLLPVYDPKGMELFAISAILVSLAAVPVVLASSVAPRPIASTRIRLGRLFRTSPAGVVACLAVGLANGSFWALGPRFAAANGLGDAGVAMLMSATVLGGALGQWPLGRLSDSGDRRRVIALAALLAGTTGWMMVSRPFGSDATLFLWSALWGAFAFPLYGLGVAHTNDHAEPDEFVETAAGLLLVYAVGAVCGPVLAAFVTDVFGPSALYAHTAAVHGLLVVFVLWRKTRHAPAPVAEQVTFVEALQAATTVSPVFDEATQADLESAQDELEAAQDELAAAQGEGRDRAGGG